MSKQTRNAQPKPIPAPQPDFRALFESAPGLYLVPLYEDPHFTFRFANDRLIPRFHLEGVEAGRRVSVFRIDSGTGERLSLLAMLRQELRLDPARHRLSPVEEEGFHGVVVV